MEAYNPKSRRGQTAAQTAAGRSGGAAGPLETHRISHRITIHQRGEVVMHLHGPCPP